MKNQEPDIKIWLLLVKTLICGFSQLNYQLLIILRTSLISSRKYKISFQDYTAFSRDSD